MKLTNQITGDYLKGEIRMEATVIRLSDLAQELGINRKALRKRLRDNKVQKPGTRWEWSPEDPTLEIIRNLKVNSKKGKGELSLEGIHQEIAEAVEEGPKEIFNNRKEDGTGWVLLAGPEGVKGEYQGPKSTDCTPWITSEDQIRKTLPKYLKEEIRKALA